MRTAFKYLTAKLTALDDEFMLAGMLKKFFTEEEPCRDLLVVYGKPDFAAALYDKKSLFITMRSAA